MSHQPEAILENRLIKQLIGLGYVSVKLIDGEGFVSNLKSRHAAFNENAYFCYEAIPS